MRERPRIRPPEIPAPISAPPLRLPQLELPPYRFVPGRHPHPIKDPAGHMASAPPPPVWSPATPWHEDQGYIRGCDLFDHRYLWEAHEAWEGIWHQVPEDNAYRGLLQALIQSAAGVLKGHVKHEGGAARLHARSVEKFEAVIATEGPTFRGLDIPEFIQRLNSFHQTGAWPVLPMVQP